MSKRRILFCGEASYLSTGFAKFNLEIIKRLHATGKYEIAEMGSYGAAQDPRSRETPWKFYPVAPGTPQEKQAFARMSDQEQAMYQFGAQKIDEVLADFQPDIVFDARDPWMTTHIQNSNFRDKFKLFLVPTVDSAPQKKDWIEGLFKKADALGTYSRFGKRTLEREGIKVDDVISPGINLDLFSPQDKVVIRDKFHMNPSLFVFGTVMRNQKRKLFPDLFDAYAKFRAKHASPRTISKIQEKVKKKKNLSKKEKNSLRAYHSVLYCHTSYPDLGWDIPGYLYRTGVQRHVIFTYMCDACGAVYASWFTPSDKKGNCKCRECGEHKAHMPNTHNGISEEQLASVYNLFDVYIQAAICEGWGLPVVESKSCGVPGMYQNYSAMEDHVENGGGIPIKIGRFYHEAETSAIRSLPDIEDIVKGMEQFAFNDKKRERLAAEARQCCVKMHDWSLTAQRVEKILDTLEIHDRAKTWDRPPEFKFLNTNSPHPKLDDVTFVHWCYINILGRMPDEGGLNNWITNLKKGAPREEILRFFRDTVEKENSLEKLRWEKSHELQNKTAPDLPDVVEETIPGVFI